jgi:carbamoyl-phosphate synthase small subunit
MPTCGPRTSSAIADIDTRKLTRILREKGAQAGCLMAGEHLDEDAALAQARAFPAWPAWIWPKWSAAPKLMHGPKANGTGPALPGPPRFASMSSPTTSASSATSCACWSAAAARHRGAGADPGAEVLALNPDGVFLSNGPGDPEPCDYAIRRSARSSRTACRPSASASAIS